MENFAKYILPHQKNGNLEIREGDNFRNLTNKSINATYELDLFLIQIHKPLKYNFYQN